MPASRGPHSAEPILHYVGACAEVQTRQRDVLTQLAGFALLMATRRARPPLCPGPLDSAAARAAEAQAMLRALRPPGEAAHHFHHLATAGDALGRAIRLAYRCLRPSSDDRDRDELMRALRTATDHLRTTARLLPGFELVDLRQACCAAHAPAPALSCTAADGRSVFMEE